MVLTMTDETIQDTLVRLVAERGSPEKVIQELRRLYPKISRKQIIHLALAQMIDRSESDLEASRALHDFAISERSAPEDEPHSAYSSDELESSGEFEQD